MNKNIFRNNIIQQIGFGLTAAALTFSYTVSACAVLGQSLLSVFLCCTVCFVASLKTENGVFAPSALLLVPIFHVFSASSPVSAFVSVAAGAFIFKALTIIFKDRKIPDPVSAGAILSLAIGATVLLTNSYFGIGAVGGTPLEMLKSYRSLGFHPNFRGLLYGTVTLFTMITYPFKFRKANRYIPAEFITVFLPLILNLFLNPQKELTTVNEAEFLTVVAAAENIPMFFSNFSLLEIPEIIKNAFAVGFLLFGCSAVKMQNKNSGMLLADALSGAVSGLPVRRYGTRGYGTVACVTAFTVTAVCILAFPQIISRIPVHSAGAMLIVSAWQNVPYKTFASIFKKRKVFPIITFAVCTVPFVMTDVFTAVVICLFVMFVYGNTPFKKEGVCK